MVSWHCIDRDIAKRAHDFLTFNAAAYKLAVDKVILQKVDTSLRLTDDAYMVFDDDTIRNGMVLLFTFHSSSSLHLMW